MSNIQLLLRALKYSKMTLKELSEATNIELEKLEQVVAGTRELQVSEAKVISPILQVIDEELLSEKDIDDSELLNSDEGVNKMKKITQTIVLTIATHKGGSGKTTVSQNLGYVMAKSGYRVLLIDTDSQTNLTRSFELEDTSENFYTCFVNKKSLEGAIVPTQFENLDIIKSSIKLSTIELTMAQMPYREKRMLEILAPIVESNKYNFIVVDTSPSLGLLNTCILNASQYVLLPVEPSSYGVDGLEIFAEHLSLVREYHDVQLLGIVLNKVNERTVITNEVRNSIEGIIQGKLLKSFIRQDNDIKNAQWQNLPVEVYNRRSRAANDFEILLQEVIESV